jgi:hypothetical protein
VTLAEKLRLLVLGIAGSLLVAAPAQGAPAGDEYLPQIPSSTGPKPVSEDPEAGVGAGSAKGEAGSAKDAAGDSGDSSGEASGSLAAGGGGDDGDDSGGGVLDTLLDPIVLLLIGGVLTIAVGLMLARRQNGDSPDPSRARRSSSDAPKPPEGEIVGGAGRS